jgi:hypothetical protein
MPRYSELEVINGAVDDIMGGRPVEEAIGEIGNAVDTALAAQRQKDEALRELLSICRLGQETHPQTYSDPKVDQGYKLAMGEIADRLAAILDGES